MWVLRYPFKTSLTVAIALAQIGEFSFILSTIGRELGLLTAVATNAILRRLDRVDRAQPAALSRDSSD